VKLTVRVGATEDRLMAVSLYGIRKYVGESVD